MPTDPAPDFVAARGQHLLDKLDQYLDGRLSHDDVASFAWSVVDDWTVLSVEDDRPQSTSEEMFWAIIWALQHLADPGHFADGTTRRELEPLVRAFRDGGEMPPGVSARRPSLSGDAG